MPRARRSAVFLGFVALFALLIALIANVLWADKPGQLRLTAWLVTIAGMTLLCACIGKSINNSWTGVIESARNRVSLSRLQMLLWSLLVLATFLCAAASNFYLARDMSALQIRIPPELLAAMGIAATSLVAAPAVLSLKATPAPEAASAAAAGISSGIHRRSDNAASSWLDIFRGDEQGNCDTPDLSKIQQFLITIGLVIVYGCLIGQQMRGSGPIAALPPLDENFVWLLGISHAGYLAYKAVPHPSNTNAPGPTTGDPNGDDDQAVG